jgi:carbon monoxide dehydrogenase subunit G
LKISGAYTLPVEPDRAYVLLQDPEILGKCMPGCDSLVRTAEHEYQMKMKMVIASLSGNFDGRVRIADHVPPTSFRLIVEGSGKIGFLKGNGLLHLSAAPGGGTEVRYEGDASVGGTIAAVGQRLVDTTARMMIKRFFDKLAAEVRPASGTAGGG